MKIFTRLLVVSLLVGGAVSDVLAEAAQRTDLAFATLEDLLKIEVTSAGRKEQELDKVAAAVFVVTQEDIRRSGATALAEVLRRVPGVQIARNTSGSWGLTVRGFNGGILANKLLVLVDGRSIYNRGGSGVFWSAEDLLLDDIQRIEVIRGPGGAVWGANAVNGVINIVTKSAFDTAGLLVRAGNGSFEGEQASVRFGAATKTTAYRVSSQWSRHDSSFLAPGVFALDNWSTFSTVARVDARRDANAFVSEATFIKSDNLPLVRTLTGPTDFQPSIQEQWNWLRGSMLGRWTHSYTGGNSFQLQSFYNFNQNNHTPDAVHFTDTEHIVDVDAELHARRGRHDLVVGGGYRYLVDHNTSSFTFSVTPVRDVAHVVNVFGQDEIAIGDRLRVTLGSKVEHETAFGWDVQPTARVMWNLGAAQQHVWAAFSRAIRRPSPLERNATLHFAAVPGESGVPLVFGLVGNPALQSERFRDLEAGYRVALGPQVSIDVTAFRGHYEGLATSEPVAPRFELTPSPYLFVPRQASSLMEADTTGAEVAVRWIPTTTFSVDGSYSHFRLAAYVDPSSQDTTSAPAAEDAPRHQWQIHSALALGRRAELAGALFHVSELPLGKVPAYTRADVRLELTLTTQLSAVVAGQSLLQEAHREGTRSDIGPTSTLVPRNVSLQLVWRLQ